MDETTTDGHPLPVIASYLVRVTVRGEAGTQPPTNGQVETAVQGTLASLVTDGEATITASSERLDQ